MSVADLFYIHASKYLRDGFATITVGDLDRLDRNAKYLLANPKINSSPRENIIKLRNQINQLKSDRLTQRNHINKTSITKEQSSSSHINQSEDDSKLIDKHNINHDRKHKSHLLDNQEDSKLSTTSAVKLQSLLQQQKVLTAKEVEIENKKQLSLTTELIDMTAILKNTTIQIHETVKIQNKHLDQIQHYATDNAIELDTQRSKLNKQEKSTTTSMFRTITTILMMIIAFVFTYAIIRIFPKP